MTSDELPATALARGKPWIQGKTYISKDDLLGIWMRCRARMPRRVSRVTTGSIAAIARTPVLLLKLILLASLFCVGLSLVTPSVAYAACTVFNFPDSHTTPSTSPMASGGALTVNIGTLCDPVGLNPVTDPNATSPQHGSISNYNSAAGSFVYTNNGDGATSDSFILVDASAHPFTVNIAIAPAGVTAPVAGPVSATVSHGSTSNPITLNLSGGAATSVAVATQATHGTATASGTTITYTPTASYSGSDSFTYTATNTAGTSAPAAVTITVSVPTITISTASVPGGTIGVAYSQTISAIGGTSPYTYTLTAGALPAGLTLSSSGTVSGTPTASGSFNFTVTARDSSTGTGAPFSGSRAYSMAVSAPTIAIAPTTLSAGTVASPYSQTITASGGTGPYTYTVTAGALPSGLTLSSSGTVSGTPTAGGNFNFTVSARDSSTGTGAPFTGSRAYSMTVSAPTIAIAPTTLSAGIVASAYSQTITASGGTSSYTYAITSGALPAGLSLSSAGTLSGTPTAGGSFNFTVTATDSSSGTGPFTGSRAYNVTVSAPTIAIAPASLPAGTTGTAYSQTITASGGTTSYTYGVTAGSLPTGLTLSPAGVLSGTPTAAGPFNFTVTATDSSTGTGPYTGSRAYSMTIGTQLPVANNVSATVAQNSSANPITLNITGGTPTSVAIATAAAHGTATATGTTITYTPTAGYAGPDSFTYTATNGGGTSAPATVTLTISAPTIGLTPA
ncbi:putative Ig domain-containing protein, partial [Rhizobium rhizogenes]|uniref:beta strand repeat-containing protein n=1 Tax=Rhizobium rhizogenes TaxID=359 RepID=UPI0022712FAC